MSNHTIKDILTLFVPWLGHEHIHELIKLVLNNSPPASVYKCLYCKVCTDVESVCRHQHYSIAFMHMFQGKDSHAPHFIDIVLSKSAVHRYIIQSEQVNGW